MGGIGEQESCQRLPLSERNDAIECPASKLPLERDKREALFGRYRNEEALATGMSSERNISLALSARYGI
jgi:hypothetical protein